MIIHLHRIAQSDKGTFGVLVWEEIPIAVTCEDPWNNNERGRSCIPVGDYQCVPHDGAKYKGVWRLENVPDRDAILIHSGNTIENTEGCILVGSSFSTLNGLPSITNSLATLERLRKVLPDRFELRIHDIHVKLT